MDLFPCKDRRIPDRQKAGGCRRRGNKLIHGCGLALGPRQPSGAGWQWSHNIMRVLSVTELCVLKWLMLCYKFYLNSKEQKSKTKKPTSDSNGYMVFSLVLPQRPSLPEGSGQHSLCGQLCRLFTAQGRHHDGLPSSCRSSHPALEGINAEEGAPFSDLLQGACGLLGLARKSAQAVSSMTPWKTLPPRTPPSFSLSKQ